MKIHWIALSILIVVLVTCILLIYHPASQNNPNPNNYTDWGEKITDIVQNDTNASKLFDNQFEEVGGIVENDSFAESFYLHNGTVYRIDVDFNTSKVLSITEEHNQTILDLLNRTKPSVTAIGAIHN